MNIGDYQIQQIEDKIEKLESINAELLAALKRTKAAILEGAQEYVLAVIEEAISKAEKDNATNP